MEGIIVVLGIILVLLLVFLLTRELWCWYWKINAKLSAQNKTNELLQNIYDALIQGNTVSAVTAGQITNLSAATAEQRTSAGACEGAYHSPVADADIPEL